MLRRLEKKDVPFMLEWMHDDDINCYFRYPFADMTAEKAIDFIEHSFDEKNKHFAIVDDNDEYLGTISLKNISKSKLNAEYAIVTRKKAHGTGAAKKATMELLEYAFAGLGLHRVYLNVLSDNIAAQRLYEKCGFLLEKKEKAAVGINGEYRDLLWYQIVRENGSVCFT